MEKTIEILEKSVKYAKKGLLEKWEKLNDQQTIQVKNGIRETLNFIETLKEIENDGNV